jgi:hypothetical protein
LERALSRHGFGFEERNIDQADFAVKVSYRPDQQKVTVYLKLKDIKSGSSYRNLKGSYWIGLDKLPSDSFSDSLDNRIGRLAAKIAAGWRRSNTLQVYVNPVVETRKKLFQPLLRLCDPQSQNHSVRRTEYQSYRGKALSPKTGTDALHIKHQGSYRDRGRLYSRRRRHTGRKLPARLRSPSAWHFR